MAFHSKTFTDCGHIGHIWNTHNCILSEPIGGENTVHKKYVQIRAGLLMSDGSMEGI